MLLADIDRIEEIRGPGGTLWGANAMNGIINIITRPAAATQGLLLTAGGGFEDHAFGAVRYGGQTGSLSYRAYLKGFSRTAEFNPDLAYDGWSAGQGGFRVDWTIAGSREVTLEGGLYRGELGSRPTVAQFSPPFAITTSRDAPMAGGNVLARLSGRTGPVGRFQLQASYDRTSRDEVPVAEIRDTADVDFQQTLLPWPRHTITWGAGYGVTSGAITSSPLTAFAPTRRTDNLFSGFLHDEIALGRGSWRTSLGAKIEQNDYSGVEVQPSARLLWLADRATDTSVFWSVTRAVRTPSRVETDYTTTSFVRDSGLPTFVRLLPNPDFVSEKVIAYEIGARSRPIEQLYLTAAGFFNDLQDMLSTELLTAFVEFDPPPARLILPVAFRNGIVGNSHGVELTGNLRAMDWWRVTGNYSYLDVKATKKPGSSDVSQEGRYEGRIPRHQVQVGTSLDLSSAWTLDGTLRYVSRIAGVPVPSYTEADVRVGWQVVPGLELAIVGQNLLHDHHLEWPSGAGTDLEIRRSVYARVIWQR